MPSFSLLIAVSVAICAVSAFDPMTQSPAARAAIEVYQPGQIVIRAKRQCNGCGCGGCNCGSVGICGASCCPSPPPPCSCGTPGCCPQTAVAVQVQVQTCCKCCQPVCTTACMNGGGCGCGCTRGGCGRKRRSLQAIEAEQLRSMAATDLFN